MPVVSANCNCDPQLMAGVTLSWRSIVVRPDNSIAMFQNQTRAGQIVVQKQDRGERYGGCLVNSGAHLVLQSRTRLQMVCRI